MTIVLHILILCVVPGFLIWLNKNVSFFKLLSPIVWCYVFGIICANIGIVPIDADLCKLVAELTVIVALPLLLINTNFDILKGQARSSLLSFFLGVLSVVLVSTFVSLFFRSFPDLDIAIGMIVGVLTGGVPNMASISVALNAPQDVYLSIATADIITGGAYLLFLTSIGHLIFRKFLSEYQSVNIVYKETGITSEFSTSEIFLSVIKALLIGLSIALLSVLPVYFLFGKMIMLWIILLLTIISFLLSFSSFIRRQKFTFETGDYILLIFSLAVGSLVNLNEGLSKSFTLVGVMALIMLLSVLLHFILAKLFKIDADTFIITSSAAIFGPPFIGPIASVLKNRELIALGISCGLVGLTIGNYAGIGVAYLIRYFIQ